MKIQKIERGIHTIELYACNLKYEQVQKVMDWLAEEKQLQIVQRDFLNIDRHAKKTITNPPSCSIPKRKPAGKCCFRQRRYCMSCVWKTMPVPEDLSFSLKNSASARWT